ncbi:MAG TPA: LLM class F420-dependent oxidoreductase [Methylomirabilota bacterium]|jgi:probable F420-dependent oxidoreductase|nr:LLM class F420-dependent oxidoreductase [Methylomirabilota bacterium]
MRFGVHLVAAGKVIEGEKIARLARRAEELGYDSVWVSDHIIFPTVLRSPYPYSPDGKLPLDPTLPLLEPFTVLSYAAAVTKTVKLGTSVAIVPYRDPIVTAKIVSSLDVLSGGRFIFGVGVGWLEEEFRVLRQNLKDRAAQTKEALLAMKACWTQEDPEFHGKFFDFSGIKFAPKPVQKPYPPIWFGGNSLPALKRAVEQGDGWHSVWMTPEEIANTAKTLRELCAKAGKDFAKFPLTINVNHKVPLTVENVKKYEEAGISMMFIPRYFGVDADEIVKGMEQFAKDVKEPVERG